MLCIELNKQEQGIIARLDNEVLEAHAFALAVDDGVFYKGLVAARNQWFRFNTGWAFCPTRSIKYIMNNWEKLPYPPYELPFVDLLRHWSTQNLWNCRRIERYLIQKHLGITVPPNTEGY